MFVPRLDPKSTSGESDPNPPIPPTGPEDCLPMPLPLFSTLTLPEPTRFSLPFGLFFRSMFSSPIHLLPILIYTLLKTGDSTDISHQKSRWLPALVSIFLFCNKVHSDLFAHTTSLLHYKNRVCSIRSQKMCFQGRLKLLKH